MKTRSLQFGKALSAALFILLLSLAGLTNAMAQEFTVGNLNYSVNDDGVSVTLTGYEGYIQGALVIPESVSYEENTYAVTAIGEWALEDCCGITSVIIPNSVTSIGDAAFYGCIALTSITIPDSVTSIHSGAFNETGWYYNQPDGILYLYNYCLGYKGVELEGNLSIREGTKVIASWAFSNVWGGYCHIYLPNTLTHIGDYAFFSSDFNGMVIPNSVIYIGDYAFAESYIDQLGIMAETPPEIGSNTFDNCNYGWWSPLSVPCGSLSIYQEAFGWSSITNIREAEFIRFDLYDSFGDGWNGYELQIVVNHFTAYYLAFEDGFSESYILSLPIPCEVQLNIFCNGWNECLEEKAEECSVVMSYAYGDWICTPEMFWQDGWCIMGDFNFDCIESGLDNTVDLGLPSGLLWATCNVGADTPESYGDYFAWGETTPKNTYTLENYTYYSENPSVLPPEHDAATANMGADWRMPTIEEWQELKDYCTSETMTIINGVHGRVFTGPNGNRLFLPAAGYSNWLGLFAGDLGCYWSSSLDINYPGSAGVFWFDHNYGCSTSGRCDGLPVRAVRWPDLSHVINVTVDPAEGGTVSGGDVYNHGTECTLIASANEGYYFFEWTENGEQVSTDPEYSFIVTGDRNLVAHFLQPFTIAATANPNEGGIITGTGEYVYGAECTLAAIANEGYIFLRWTENGEVVSTETTYSFTVTADRDLVADFAGSEAGAYVDLGLPSGLLWATCNVGAEMPEDYGNYFAWGETQPKDYYDWSTYQYCNGSENTLTKYCNNSSYGYNGFTDDLTILLPEDDAATANWGSDWRMPTQAEIQELLDNTTFTWTQLNGVNGRLFTAANGNSLFLPAAGYRGDSSLFYADSIGNFWSSSLKTDGPNYARRFYSDWGNYGNGSSWRSCGQSVRPVRITSSNSSLVINAMASPMEGGTVTGGAYYEAGTFCRLTAKANEGYSFSNWTENGEVVSTDATYCFSVISNRTLVANFTYSVTNGHAYVDLGLPSGTLWATCNVGANTPENYGDYLDYNGTTTAIANWGQPWRMPTKEEWEELFQNTTSTWTTQNGVNGRLFTALNGKEVFLPAAGVYTNGTLYGAGSSGVYWSSLQNYITNFNSEFYTVNWIDSSDYDVFYYCITIRPVRNASESFIISATPSPTEYGTVSGAGNYLEGQTCVLTATANPDYTFVNWTKDGEVVSTEATYSFIVTESASFVANFVIGQSVVSSFTEGWNWWSTYIEQDGIDGLSLLEEGLGTNGLVIKSQSDGYTEYYDDYDLWYGSLNSINNEASYLVKTSAPCTVSMTGTAAVPSQHPITVDADGWTWIGYPVAYDMDINMALDGLASIEGDMLKAQEGYAEFYEGYGWYGPLETLTSGMGYMYKSNNASPTTFTYPSGSRGDAANANLSAKDNHWVPMASAYPFNMTVTAIVEFDGEELRSDRYELAAFANGESRGSVRLMYVEPIDRYVAFLTIAGEEAADLSLSLYDTETSLEYFGANETLGFEANATLGRLAEPFVVSFRGTTGMDELANSLRIYPNPVNAGERFSIGMNAECKAPVRVEIVNALGITVSVETSTQAPASIVAPVTAGVYTLRVTVDGKGTAVRKLVVK